jgi:hypothetical protein
VKIVETLAKIALTGITEPLHLNEKKTYSCKKAQSAGIQQAEQMWLSVVGLLHWP